MENDLRETMRDNFVAFILTHGRADRVITYKTLRDRGYTGRIVLVIDNEDADAEKYRTNFGNENVRMFNKAAVAETFDEGVRGDRRTIVYARNACFQVAREMGVRYFVELDDDYEDFMFRFDDEFRWKYSAVKSLDRIFEIILRFFISCPACVKSIALAQNGDLIGGGSNNLFGRQICLRRKAMNSFFCDTERPFVFVGRINEDVNTYTRNSHWGDVFFTENIVSLNQIQTQSNKGGMTDVYVDTGTYVKSFFTVMYHPSGTKISMMGSVNRRIHHNISWNNTAPKIMSEKWRKTPRTNGI